MLTGRESFAVLEMIKNQKICWTFKEFFTSNQFILVKSEVGPNAQSSVYYYYQSYPLGLLVIPETGDLVRQLRVGRQVD